MDVSIFIRQTINILADFLSLFIVGRVLISWFRSGFRESGAFGLSRFVYEVTEPILSPIRKIIPMLGAFDISPIVAILLIDLIRNLANSYL